MKRGRPRTKLPVDEMVRWYRDEGLSTCAITKRLRELGYRVSCETVRSRLKERGVLRDQKTATKLANIKYLKTAFNGDGSLMAYLLGLVNDFNVQQSGKQILVQVSTTHPGMERLFVSLFPEWSSEQLYRNPIYVDSEICKGYNYILTTYLHYTFNFLLKKPAERFWKWTLWAIQNHFWDFFAGFIDAEGSVEIDKALRFFIQVCSNNLRLLNTVRRKLQEFQFHPSKICERKSKNGYNHVFALNRKKRSLKRYENFH